MKQNISILLSFLIAFILIRCSNPVSGPPDIPIKVLLSSPDTLKIESQPIVLRTYLWRDFMPISPPDGKPLIALIYIETPDSSNLPSSISSDAVYIVNNNQVWKTFFSSEDRPPDELKPYRITKIARDGPKWGPNVYVDVVVRILHGNKKYLLKAGRQYIGRTD